MLLDDMRSGVRLVEVGENAIGLAPTVAAFCMLLTLGLSSCRSPSSESEGSQGSPSGTPSASASNAPLLRRTPPRGEPMIVAGEATGYEALDNGSYLLRAEVRACPRSPPSSVPCPRSGKVKGGCRFDTDCTEHPNGYCAGGFLPSCACEYGCLADSDCASDSVCICGPRFGHCEKALCRTHEECSEGTFCASTITHSESSYGAFECRPPPPAPVREDK